MNFAIFHRDPLIGKIQGSVARRLHHIAVAMEDQLPLPSVE
jgi:hypothetical protein